MSLKLNTYLRPAFLVPYLVFVLYVDVEDVATG